MSFLNGGYQLGGLDMGGMDGGLFVGGAKKHAKRKTATKKHHAKSHLGLTAAQEKKYKAAMARIRRDVGVHVPLEERRRLAMQEVHCAARKKTRRTRGGEMMGGAAAKKRKVHKHPHDRLSRHEVYPSEKAHGLALSRRVRATGKRVKIGQLNKRQLKDLDDLLTRIGYGGMTMYG